MKWLAAALIAAAMAQAQPKRDAAHRVVESFQVGDGVYVRALAVEPARNALWVGTSSGLHEVELPSGRLRATYTRKDGLASEHVFAITVDAQGYKWVGTSAGGASRYRDGRWKTYFPIHGLADYRVSAFAEDPRGALWMGTFAGASRFERKTGRFRNFAKELPNDRVRAAAVDANGRVWLGTEGGLSMFDGKAWRAWTHADGVGAPRADSAHRDLVLALHAGRDGALWSGTWGGGAARFDGERWTSLTTKDGLAGDIVYSIAQEPAGALWFGTNAGLSRYEGGRFRTLGARDGLLEPNVYAIAVAPDGEIWAGTRRGVSRISKRSGAGNEK